MRNRAGGWRFSKTGALALVGMIGFSADTWAFEIDSDRSGVPMRCGKTASSPLSDIHFTPDGMGGEGARRAHR